MLAWPYSARAVDGIAVELGSGDQSSHLGRLALDWTWSQKHPLGPHLQWGGYWELSLGQWQNGERVFDIGITPVFRLERSSGGVVPYLEGGIGLHLESQVEFSEHRTTGTKFQFGDHLGAGARFGDRQRHEIGMRLQHISNGGIAKPNPGINFAIARYEYHFE